MRTFIEYLHRFFAALNRFEGKMRARWDARVNFRTTLFLLLAASLATFVYTQFLAPPDSFPMQELVSVPEGASLPQIAQVLEAQGVIRSPAMFQLIARATGHACDLHAGDYLFKTDLDVWQVARTLAIGAYGLEPTRVRVPEGATTKEMAQLFSSRLPRFNATLFLAEAQPMEGFLFPDTYFFLPNATEDSVIQAMKGNFDKHEAVIDAQIQASGHSLKDIVTMASIIEREAQNATDRRMISGVLWNRLAKNMPLQVDVTFLYTIGKGSAQLTMTDLKSDSPYNTYRYKGLPPTPIGSPSMDSLEAALNPTPSKYLYYLADSSGITHYSVTYQQHVAKQAEYIGN